MYLKFKKLYLIGLLIAFTGCGWFASDTPCQQHLDQRAMTLVLTDVFLLESQLSLHQSQTSSKDSVGYFYAGIFEKHGITVEQFEEAFECYMLEEEQMISLMDDVLSSLSIIQSRLEEKKAEDE